VKDQIYWWFEKTFKWTIEKPTVNQKNWKHFKSQCIIRL